MAATERRCRVCSCTDMQACPGGCSWAGPDLCSSCATAAGAGAEGTMAVVAHQRLLIAGSSIKLSRTEAVVMKVLVGAPDRLVEVDALHAAMYPNSKPPSRESNVLQVLVSRVRRKLAAAGHKHAIETIRLRGYRFVMPQGSAA
ncbi:TPA: helix-turn-helix domain-containing protein [Stenotrophomonas maltophilia]|uniref:helix-turn-helix domain-containing protein n=1 Tax=Stenotrophomonas maltophilia TaxID=40324 RepID=UPI000C1560CF|nr:helix-turn-helix domain-containing protein [Stenotrophomonas maltophilia]MBA0331630.1 helix-turn-helix domain-containing protein [Stenotrophomonas maltophilia]MBN5120327.1 helix-turn-helix domain-containing protein [Stenotrophomonas maltophilia]MBO3001995.1 helix-turn-helix domain-containing protein [Stenotrophomonas maltophilia]MBP1382123.1 helix-turn-helix domain-containing protein [Stenotrophomonas maltophilia]MBP1387042.1 helix-turn-helix domain-containing protein [Stenotrophomonas malt